MGPLSKCEKSSLCHLQFLDNKDNNLYKFVMFSNTCSLDNKELPTF